MDRMENDKIAERIYVGECAGSCSMGRPRKRWIDTVKDCLRKRSLDARETRRMVKDRSEYRGIVWGSVWGIEGGMKPQNLDVMPQLWVVTAI